MELTKSDKIERIVFIVIIFSVAIGVIYWQTKRSKKE